MRGLTEWFRAGIAGMKLRHKLVGAIYLVLLPVLLASSVLLYTIEYRTTIAESTATYERLTQSACAEIGYLQRDVQDLMTYLAVNEEFHQIFIRSPETPPENRMFWYTETPVTFLKNILAIKNYIKTLVIYPENGFPAFAVSRDASVHQTDLQIVRRQPIYTQALEALGDVGWQYVGEKEQGLYQISKSDKILAYRELFNISKAKRLAFVVISTDASQYLSICDHALRKGNETIAVLDGNGKLLLRAGGAEKGALSLAQSPQVQEGLQRQGSLMLHQDGYFLFACRSDISGAGLCYLVPQENLTSQLNQSIYLPALMAALLLLIAIPLSTLVSRLLTRSTDHLCKSMEQFRNGDFTQQISITSDDEIGELARSFNAMVQHIRTLIDKNYVMALRERQSELNALQAQINPHFLYNVMNALYWQAENAGNGELAENILTLSTLFRLLLNQGNSMIRAQQEAELIRAYLHIQKVCFGNALAYTVSVDDAVADCLIPKLMIQPFVENAVVHGLEQKAEGGVINVKGTIENEFILFSVEDNGVGMEQAAADRLLSETTSDPYRKARVGHYAIGNIKQRLSLRYGSHYILKIRSAVGKGTKVWIGIPMEEVTERVQDSDCR